MLLFGHLGIAIGLAYLLDKSILQRSKRRIDYRFLLLGSILPDLIDKPLSLAGIVGGRAIGHTLIFAIVVIASVAVLESRGWKSGILLGISLGIGTHLLLDTLWTNPEVLFWPALGFSFPTGGMNLDRLLHTLLTDPYVYGGEIIGMAMLIGFVANRRLYTRRGLRLFLSGQ